MKFPVNLELFADTQHSPSIFALADSMKAAPGTLRDYCIPVNPYFPTPEIFASLRARFDSILKYYPSSNQDIGTRLSDFVNLDPDTMVLGNGSTELISFINRLLVKESLAIPVPTFSRWTADPTVSGKRVHTFLRRPEKNFRLTPAEFVAGVLRHGARAAVLCNPNNPTGALMSRADVLTVLDALGDLDVVVIDESFIDFAAENEVPSVAGDVTRFPNAVVLKSLGKNLGLHGLRMGYAVANPDLIGKLRTAIPFWNMNSVAQALIEELPAARHEYESGRRRVVRDRIYLERRLRTIPGLTVYPAEANFVYVRMPDDIEGVALRNHLLVEHGCLVRECGNKEGSDSRHFRIAARPSAETDHLVDKLQLSFSALARGPYPRRGGTDPARHGWSRSLPSSRAGQFPRRAVLGGSALSAALFLTWTLLTNGHPQAKDGVAVRDGVAASATRTGASSPPSTPVAAVAAKASASGAPPEASSSTRASASASSPTSAPPQSAPTAGEQAAAVASNDTASGALPPASSGDTRDDEADAPGAPPGTDAAGADAAEGPSRPLVRTDAKRRAAKRRAARQRRLRRLALADL